MDVKLQTKKSLKSENNTSLLITKSVYEIVRSLLKRFKFACAAQFIYKSIMCTYSTYAEYINTIFYPTLKVTCSTPGLALSGNKLGQVVHSDMPLSSSNIIWYRSRDGDALRLGR